MIITKYVFYFLRCRTNMILIKLIKLLKRKKQGGILFIMLLIWISFRKKLVLFCSEFFLNFIFYNLIFISTLILIYFSFIFLIEIFYLSDLIFILLIYKIRIFFLISSSFNFFICHVKLTNPSLCIKNYLTVLGLGVCLRTRACLETRSNPCSETFWNFFLLKINIFKCFWNILMRRYQKWFKKNKKKTSSWCISKRKTL